jgi:hypothetical protein
MFIISTLILILGLVLNFTFAYPWHASCRIEWNLGESCDSVHQKLHDQMTAWNMDSPCPGISDTCPQMPCGQKCLYQFQSLNGNALKGTPSRNNTLKGTHTTPVARYIDDLTFTTEQTGENTCKVTGFSTSQTWYAVLDWGTNYCNLRNLLDGSELSNSNGFTEETSNSVCTQYTSRNCDRY